MTERTLLRQLKDGDTGALSEIIGLYTPYLYTIASNIMAPQLPREDIEEAVSDAFVELWTHRAELLPGKLKPWLAAVVRNKAKDALRAHKAGGAPERRSAGDRLRRRCGARTPAKGIGGTGP